MNFAFRPDLMLEVLPIPDTGMPGIFPVTGDHWLCQPAEQSPLPITIHLCDFFKFLNHILTGHYIYERTVKNYNGSGII